MTIVEKNLRLSELKKMSELFGGVMVKAVVDIEREWLAVDSSLHSDLESLLLAKGSQQANLWGINIYPDKPSAENIEFDSMINIRPNQKNFSRNVEDEKTRQKIRTIVRTKVNYER